MQALSPSASGLIEEVARRHGFSVDAVRTMLQALVAGNGSMAQFNHPEFAGSGQWMRGGMTMVSDMFNNQLKHRVDSLCSELAKLVADQPDLVRSGSFQSQSQGGDRGQAQTQRHGAAAQYQGGAGSHDDNGRRASNDLSADSASLFVPPAPGRSGDWWPFDLRFPDSTGSQNGVRYACFSQAHRLVIDVGGTVTVYDTQDHRIGGFSQQQSSGATLSFSSQHGLVDVASLPVVSSNGKPPATADLPPGNAGRSDVFATIERLADLKSKGILSDDEFSTKKAELLSRV